MSFKKLSVYDEFIKKSYSSGKRKSTHVLNMYGFIFGSIRWTKNQIVSFFDNHLIHYPTPINLNYAWSFGSSAGICLVIQIISGLFLAIHYTPHIDYAFNSVDFIMREVPQGWLLRYSHANGASVFFIVVYAHMVRGLYYGSYMHPRQMLWCSGVVIFLLMMATAFMGYVLPWGQMSYWGASVITRMVTIVPKVGQYIAEWFWGGFTIKNPTLRRFFILHFTFPFIIVGFTFLHLTLLHKHGSNNPLGVDSNIDKIPFYPYFFLKDLFAFFCLMLLFVYLVFFEPNYLGHPDNYIPADPIHTPKHVVPEWYFLPFYAILRSIPRKTAGILGMLGSILILLTLPFFNTSEIRSTNYRPIFKFFFWAFITDCFILGWAGQLPIIDRVTHLGQIATVCYFIFFIFIVPITGIVESKLARYDTSKF